MDIKPQSDNEFLSPNPETCENPAEITGINKRIYEELGDLKQRE